MVSRFNRGLTYVAICDSKFFLKSNDNFISYLDKIGIKAVYPNTISLNTH